MEGIGGWKGEEWAGLTIAIKTQEGQWWKLMQNPALPSPSPPCPPLRSSVGNSFKVQFAFHTHLNHTAQNVPKYIPTMV